MDVPAKSQFVQNRISGRVVRECEPKHAIKEINAMVKKLPTFLVQNSTPYIPEWSDGAAPIKTQIREITETLLGPLDNLYASPQKGINYLRKIKLL